MNNEPVAWMIIDVDNGKSLQFEENKFSEINIPLYTAPQGDGCGNCHACLVGVIENHMPVTSQRMIVCSDCGNKRCPKASNHRHKCTGSNEVGQYGSIYTAPRELSDEEIDSLIAEYKIGEFSGFYVDKAMTESMQRRYKNVLDFARAILKKASER